MVKIDTVFNEELELICGVSQGTILGTLLILIYNKDVLELNLYCNITSHADATALVIEGNNWQVVKTITSVHVHVLNKWLQ